MSSDDDDSRAVTPASHQRGRTIVAAVLGVLAVLLLTVGAVAVWAKATVLRSEEVAALVGEAIAESEVQAALAALVADQVQDAVGLEARLVDVLPDRLDRFAASIAAGTSAAVERALGRALAEPAVQDAIETSVERAHEQAMALLRGDGLTGGLSVDDGAVTLNLLPLVARGLLAVQDLGVLEGVTVPELTLGGDPDEQAAQLGAAIGRDLPEGFAQLVVYDSENLAEAQEAVQTAQRMLVLAERAIWLVVVLSIVLVAGTIVIAPRRGRAVLVLSLGIAAAMVVLRSAVRRVVAGAEDLAPRPGGKAAIRTIVGGSSESLLRLAAVLLLAALVAATIVILVRRRWREDLVITAAVVVGAATVAVIGLSIGGLVAGLLIGVAIPFVTRWALRPRAEMLPDDDAPAGDVDSPSQAPSTSVAPRDEDGAAVIQR